MLNLKKLLTKVLNRTNFRIVTVESSAFNMTGSGTNWVTVPLPSSGRAIAVQGYYIIGNTLAHTYSINLTSNGAQFALRNGSSTAVNGVKINAYYLVVD